MMKYLVVGVGGTGGCLAAYLGAAGKDVDVIARGAHLEAIRADGLRLAGSDRGTFSAKVAAYTAEEYTGHPDVIFVCVKGYAIDGIVPLLEKASGPDTIVIPVLNLIDTGEKLAAKLPQTTVLDACIYVSAYISAPGEITKGGPLLRVVYGEREGNAHREKLDAIAVDLTESGIDAIVSDNIRRDTFRKFMFLSAFAAAGAYLDATAGQLWEGEGQEWFLALNSELQAIAAAQGITYDEDMTAASVRPLRGMPAGGTTSLQKDLEKGGASEVDGLVLEPVRLGRRYGVPTPRYEQVAAKLLPGVEV